MATLRFRGQEIGSLTPALDARSGEDLYVVGGRNFSFDSKGPKTDFGDRLMTPIPLRDPTQVHGTRISGRSFVHTVDSLLEYDTGISAWIPQFHFWNVENPEITTRRWTAAFLNRTIFFAHVNYGYVRVSTLSEDTDQIFIRTTTAEAPGIPDSPLGIVETNGRLVVLTDTSVYWSGPSDGLDWTPAEGGAGVQVIADRVGGDPLVVTAFSGGFIVWTTSGALLAEFIGGAVVFRFSVLMTANRPQNSFSVVQLNQDESLFLTNQGLFLSKNGQVPQAIQPPFNEYIRDYLTLNPRATGRLEYDAVRDRLYVQLKTHAVFYDKTYVLIPTISKWGEFSERNYGVLPLTADEFGWVGQDRLVRKWIEDSSREALPDTNQPELKFLRIPKRSVDSENIWSTSGICQNTSHSNQIREGFFALEADSPRSPTLIGLNAEIQLGYFHPGQLEQSADGLIEVQQIILGSYPMAIPTELVPGNLEYDTFEELYSQILRAVEDWESADPDPEDYNILDEEEDFGGTFALLSPNGYDIELRSSQDGFTEQAIVPERARFDTKATTYSCLSSGTLHKLVLTANDPGDRIQVRYLEMTLGYGGRLV